MNGLNILSKDKIYNVRNVAVDLVDLMNGIMYYNKDNYPHIYKEFIIIKDNFLNEKNYLLKTVS